MAATGSVNSVSSIVPAFNVINKWVLGLFCNVLSSREAQQDASVTQVLLEDGGQETRDKGDARHAGHHRGVALRLLAMWSR